MFTDEVQVIIDPVAENRDHDYMPAPGHYDFNLDIGKYPDGMPVVNADTLRHLKEGTTVDMVLRPKSLEAFVNGMFMTDALHERKINVSRLILPFIPAARQDRINPEGDYLFTIKSVAKMINDRRFDSVLVLDPHSNVAPALIDRVSVFPLATVLDNYYVGYDAVIAPDAGAVHRAAEAAKALGDLRGTPIPVIQAEKSRDVATGKLSGFNVTVESGKHYLVFDDICDGGGTFLGLGEKIVEQGAKAGLFVSHGVFSKGTEDLNKIYSAITTTDSTLFDKHDARVIPVVGRMINS